LFSPLYGTSGSPERHQSGASGTALGKEMGNTRKTPPSTTDFMAAIESGDTELVERLIAQGANIHGDN